MSQNTRRNLILHAPSHKTKAHGAQHPQSRSPASTPQGRANFASTAVRLLADCGFDGLDIDWEYPASAAEAQDFVHLLAETRTELHHYASRVGQPPSAFLLTVACPAGPPNFEKLRVAEMDRYLDFWNLMGYDYAGSWDSAAGHQANIFPAKDGKGTPFSTATAVEFYLRAGVAPGKLVLGCPLYGRAFVGTSGPGKSFSGVGEGSWENGVWDWKALPRESAEVKEDMDVVASWSMDKSKGEMVSFDSARVAERKAEWVRERGMGGVMWWESSGDRGGEESLIAKVVGRLGGTERRENCIVYPESRFENLRKGLA